MKAGFSIKCLRCKAIMEVIPGDRDKENEPIEFGTASETWPVMNCKCGNEVYGERDWNEVTDTQVYRWVDDSR